ncbi:MAG: trigger factor family protein, partial [Kiritimatiellia bacterium]|nr:trigger factor family protein [Kiritimatiellia bacterium]
MKVKVEKGGPCRKTLVVELPIEEVEAEYKKVLLTYTSIARIPGFRQGHAPANLVESHLAKEIWEETKDRLIGLSYPEAIKQAQLKPVMILDLKSETAPKKPMVYRVILDVPPDFKLPKYKNIAVTNKPVEVSDEDVQKAFNRFMDRMATTEAVTNRSTHKGDLVQIDYTRKDNEGVQKVSGGKQSDPLAAGHDFWLAINEDD